MSLLFILKGGNPWSARSALSSASTAYAHAELVASPDELLVAVLDGVDLAAWVGRLVGVGVKLSILEVVAFDHFSIVGAVRGLLLDRVGRCRVGWRSHTAGFSSPGHSGRERATARLDRVPAPLGVGLEAGDGVAGIAKSR
jgi:hypothetical protein